VAGELPWACPPGVPSQQVRREVWSAGHVVLSTSWRH
jgi:hypothetical protein